MTLKKAVLTTIDDVLKRDPVQGRLAWLIVTFFLLPALPLVVWYRLGYEEPERNPDFTGERVS